MEVVTLRLAPFKYAKLRCTFVMHCLCCEAMFIIVDIKTVKNSASPRLNYVGYLVANSREFSDYLFVALQTKHFYYYWGELLKLDAKIKSKTHTKKHIKNFNPGNH